MGNQYDWSQLYLLAVSPEAVDVDLVPWPDLTRHGYVEVNREAQNLDFHLAWWSLDYGVASDEGPLIDGSIQYQYRILW
jgi:hypothetical protein